MRVGRYQLISLLGAGGMGEVWKAIDPTLEREVAIKVLTGGLASDPDFRARFLREARLAARLNHPNIATIYAVREQDSAMYLVMELVQGDSLDKLIDKGPLPERQAIDIAIQVASAIGEAHDHGIVHRDIKPANIMIAPRGVKVLDFGIAREIAPQKEAWMTQVGTIIGTPHYMSPEQAQGQAIERQSDIFSLGAVLYEMLAGAPPFDGDSMVEVLLGVIAQAPAKLKNVSPELAAIVMRCLEKKPAARFTTAEQLGDALWNVVHAMPEQYAAPTLVMDAPVFDRVLVADDDPLSRHLMRAALERMGWCVDEANDGAEAIRLLKINDYEALITDILMPRLDGWSVVDFVRTCPSRRPHHVFVASTMRDVRLSTVDKEIVEAVVVKPFVSGQLDELFQRTATIR